MPSLEFAEVSGMLEAESEHDSDFEAAVTERQVASFVNRNR